MDTKLPPLVEAYAAAVDRRVCEIILASDHGDALTLTVPGSSVTASTVTRTLAGPVVRYGVHGRTSRGRLKVAPGALRFPPELSRVKLTREHVREDSRGHLTAIEDDGTTIRASLKVSDGPEGDAALREAADKTRDGFSFDVIDAQIVGDTITSGLVIAIGQVGIPAYDDTRIDTVAASLTIPEGPVMTPEQIARLAALRAQATRTDAEETELGLLAQLEAAQPAVQQATDPAPAATSPAAGATDGASVAASLSSVPVGVPAPVAHTAPAGGALQAFCESLAGALPHGGSAITAALNDVTHAQHSSIIEPPAWSGELWSGLQYEPEFSDLFNTGDLTNFEGKGWRWKTKPQMQDYAGNKAAIPTDTPETEAANYSAARMAVGHDFDRKFYDFNNDATASFLRGYAEAVRESWAMKLDVKVKNFILANAVAITGPDGADVGTDPDPVVETSVFKAVARLMLVLKRRKVGRASFILMNDEDWMSLFDVTTNEKPAFLDLFNIDPANFRFSADVPAGTVIGGVKQTATVRTLPGSPIRVDAQRIANGGVDTGWFGYWAIEEHHTSGIASVQLDLP